MEETIWHSDSDSDTSDSMIICDVCGKEFSYPDEGQLQQGFGICDKCGKV